MLIEGKRGTKWKREVTEIVRSRERNKEAKDLRSKKAEILRIREAK